MNTARFSASAAWLLACCWGGIGAARADSVTALGRIAPAGGVFDLVASVGDIVTAVTVQEGEWVPAGAPLAQLSSLPLAEAQLRQADAQARASRAAAEADVALARLRLAAAQEGDRIEGERLRRILATRGNDLISQDKIEERQLARSEAALRLATALDAVARAERAQSLDRDQAALHHAELAREVAARDLRAPFGCRVLKILIRAGGIANSGSMMKLGDTSHMVVIAEIYEADALKVRPGQKVSISSPALPRQFAGVVGSVGSMVFRNSLQSLDPNAQTNNRVVEAVIRMDDREPLDRLVFLPVDVTIQL